MSGDCVGCFGIRKEAMSAWRQGMVVVRRKKHNMGGSSFAILHFYVSL
jgi:hypothetical protein